jgi:gluconokinase
MSDENMIKPIEPPQSWVVMGVSGAGKTEIARQLAARLGIAFIDGDRFHSSENIAKMSAGIPLTDEDRQEWLLTLRHRLRQASDEGQAVVLACSALKRRYRDMLRGGNPALIFVYLDGDRDLLASRMKSRQGHFMPASMLDSQLATLEPPQADERYLKVDIRPSPEQIVDRIMAFRQALTDGTRPP